MQEIRTWEHQSWAEQTIYPTSPAASVQLLVVLLRLTFGGKELDRTTPLLATVQLFGLATFGIVMKSILLAEDELDLQEMSCYAIERKGYEVVAVSDGAVLFENCYQHDR